MNNKKIIIIDYGMGNLRSVQKKFKKIGAEALISNDINEIESANKLVLPGVGHFANGIYNLKSLGFFDLLNKRVLIDKVPILGICLGMQLMAKKSEEGDVEGFGWFDADVKRFIIHDKLKHKVPHMGWNNLDIKKKSKLLDGTHEEAMFYFVHSYYVVCNKDDDILSNTIYENEFTSSIEKDNIFGTQFHPEKSHEWGEKILRNFVEI